MPEHDLYLGSLHLSTIKTEKPLSAKIFPAVAPAGPPPAIITSYIQYLFSIINAICAKCQKNDILRVIFSKKLLKANLKYDRMKT